MKRLNLISKTPTETEYLGQQLGSILKKGMFIALKGELGGGKTCFTRGVVAGAAPQSAYLVASPTFAIMNEYPGTPPLYHFDFYRLACGHEIVELGFEEYFLGHGICIAEWADRLGELLPEDRLDITFEIAGEESRTITLEASGPDSQALLAQLAQNMPEKIFL